MTDVQAVAPDTVPQQPREAPPTEPVHLAYPQILLQASFASLLSSSFPSTSETQVTTMPASERSLGESWASLSEADFTPESDYTPEDDSRSEATDIVSLVDTNASEDLQGNEELHEAPQLGLDQEQVLADVREPTELSIPMQRSVSQMRDAQPYDSTSTIGAPSPNAIKFVEAESWPMTGRVDLMHSIKVFDEQEKLHLANFIPKVHRAAQLNGTIRMTTSRGSIRRDRPFRLLYSGSPQATETRAEILKKIGDVLVASSNMHVRHSMDASRYHVIPSEFGPGASPNYAELIPLQFQQMIVDECIKAEAFKQDSAQSQIQLKYKGGQSILSLWDGAAYRVPKGSGWDPPDLAIIFVRQSDDTARQLFSGRLNEFTSRHHILTLVIRDDNDWSTSYDYIVPDRRSLHMCVESRATGILQLLPIDLSSFINLDAGQLNKHVACLCAIYDQDAERQKIALKLRQTQQSRDTPGDVEKNLSKSIVAQNGTKAFLVKHENAINKVWYVSAGVLVLMLAFSICREVFVVLAAYFGGAMSMTSIAPSTTAHAVQPIASMVAPTAMTPTAIASMSTSLQVTPSVARFSTHSMDKELARMVSDAAAVHNTSDNFQVQILGDSYVVVKVPQKLLGRKHAPKLTITVMKGSKAVPSNTSKLFDGVYTVKIDREHASGLLKLTLCVKKPSITETHRLDFGTPWVPAEKLKVAFSHIWQPLHDKIDFIEQDPRVAFATLLNTAQGRLQSVSLTGMKIAKNLTAQYGPSVRRMSQNAQSRSRDLYLEAVRRAKTAAQLASRETQAEVQTLGTLSQLARRQASEFAYKVFADISSGLTYVRDHATSIQLEDVRDKMVPRGPWETLAEAQERARQVREDIRAKLESRREHFKAKKAGRRKARADKKCKKRVGEWHDNVRVRLPNLGL